MYPIELTKEEFGLLRQSLDIIQISGKSAKFVANLQDKLDEQLFQIDLNVYPLPTNTFYTYNITVYVVYT